MAKNHEELQNLLTKIYRERGFDFRRYRESTLERRLGRLHARRSLSYADYARVLDQDSTEYDRLFDDLTINVTSFLRDRGAFQALGEVVLPTLSGNGGNRVRIWSAGCASGEETYSIAMLVLEILGQEMSLQNVTILGTDIDTKALNRAQGGWFTSKDVEGLSPKWLDRYFISEGVGFRVGPQIRHLVTFEVHNLVCDPPYHDLELIVCRNVLIYFNLELQAQVLNNFCDGLKEGGFLLLGKAEVLVGETKRMFHCVNSQAKLYRKMTNGGDKPYGATHFVL